MFLRQSTSVTITLGGFVDDSDGKTAETALSLTVYVAKNGGVATARSSAGAISHDRDGDYRVPLDATDTGTGGLLRVSSAPAGALRVWRDYVVLPAQRYDSLIAGSDLLQVHVDEITAGLINAVAIGTGAIDADAIATDAVTKLQNGLAMAAALATVSAYVDELETRLTATRAGYLDNLSGGSVATAAAVAAVAAYIDTEVAAILAAVDTEIAAILAKVNNLPAAPAAVGSAMTLATDAVNASSLATSAVTEIQAGLSTLTAAQVNAEVVDVLSVDTYAEPGAVPGATSSLKDKIAWLFALARNKHVTSATQDRVRNDGDTADLGTAALSDDGSNFTRGKYS